MKHLSKSQYTRGLQCAKSLWFYRERKDLQDPTAPDQQAIFDQGTEVGILAQKWIPGGVLIKADHTDPEAAIAETLAALQLGAKVLYEAAFLYEGVLVRADIIATNMDGGWDLFEVKSTTEVKDIFLQDVAIQRHVLAGAGMVINAAHVVHLDPAYVRKGPLDLKALFLSVDVTRDTEALLDTIPETLREMKKMAAQPEPPAREIGPHCTKPYDCSFIGHCWKEVPDYSVFNLAGALMKKKTALWNKGIKTVDAIPDYVKGKKDTDDFKLTDYQNVQRRVAITGKAHIDAAGIRALLENLAYPQHFLDFEAVNPAIPQYDGTRPYQQLPFEASLHIRRERGAALEHYEYLADGTKDPRPELVAFLLERIGPSGSVVAFNKSYEGGIIKGMAYGHAAANEMLSMESRLWDLADFFRKALYAHPGFVGSWSIKKVLPILVPSMKYEGMAIADGVAAMQAYTRLMTENLSATERAQIMADLRAYCGQDTLAMVKILDQVETDIAVAA